MAYHIFGGRRCRAVFGAALVLYASAGGAVGGPANAGATRPATTTEPTAETTNTIVLSPELRLHVVTDVYPIEPPSPKDQAKVAAHPERAPVETVRLLHHVYLAGPGTDRKLAFEFDDRRDDGRDDPLPAQGLRREHGVLGARVVGGAVVVTYAASRGLYAQVIWLHNAGGFEVEPGFRPMLHVLDPSFTEVDAIDVGAEAGGRRPVLTLRFEAPGFAGRSLRFHFKGDSWEQEFKPL